MVFVNNGLLKVTAVPVINEEISVNSNTVPIPIGSEIVPADPIVIDVDPTATTDNP
jgi:hypothetical protein